MAYKIHKRGAFVIIENTVNGELKELNSQFVQITKGKTSLDQYEVLYNGVPQLKAVLGDIQDVNGVAYVEADWDTFRYEQCGSVNSSEVANPYPAPTVATVDITSDQIKEMGTTAIELLPALGVNQWYDVDKIILIMNRAGTAYTTTEPALYTTGAYFAFENILTNIDNHSKSNSYGTQSVVDNTTFQASEGYGLPLGNGLHLTTWGGTNPTDGTCTMTAIITYTTKTFGA